MNKKRYKIINKLVEIVEEATFYLIKDPIIDFRFCSAIKNTPTGVFFISRVVFRVQYECVHMQPSQHIRHVLAQAHQNAIAQ